MSDSSAQDPSSKRPSRHEIVVFWLRRDSTCDECGTELYKGSFLRKEESRGLCMECADLGELLFLPAGDAALTRRAGRYSPARVIVVRFARARKRYERQGILVTADGLERAEAECLADADVRERRRERAAVHRERLDEEYMRRFAARIRELYPHCPKSETENIARWTCTKWSGRVGRSTAAKALDEAAVDLAVRAHVRHLHTDYEERLFRGEDRAYARERVEDRIQDVLCGWQGNAEDGAP
jgi:hypothetical protein